MEQARQDIPVWGPPILMWAAVFLASVISGADALIMQNDVSLSVGRFVSFIGLPGGIGAQYLNWVLHGGHSVTSPAREFLLSLPFNTSAYWMLIRGCTGMIWLLHARRATTK
jgi:hypothetical protein